MGWFRNHQRALLRMALVLWVLTLAVAAGQGCLSYPEHAPALAHAHTLTSPPDPVHQLHASGCLQLCADSESALKPAAVHLLVDQIIWALLFTLPALVLLVAISPRFAARALHLPAPPRPPLRLSFVRFHD